MLKKISSVTKTLQKMHLFFFRELRLITVLLLIHKSYTGWSTSFISVKQWYFPFSIPPCFFLSLYFCSAKRRGSLTLKCYNSFKNKNNRKKTHSFAPKLLVFKLQQEFWKFIDICVSWSFQNLTWKRTS